MSRKRHGVVDTKNAPAYIRPISGGADGNEGAGGEVFPKGKTDCLIRECQVDRELSLSGCIFALRFEVRTLWRGVRASRLLLFDNLICERKRSVGGDVLAVSSGSPGWFGFRAGLVWWVWRGVWEYGVATFYLLRSSPDYREVISVRLPSRFE